MRCRSAIKGNEALAHATMRMIFGMCYNKEARYQRLSVIKMPLMGCVQSRQSRGTASTSVGGVGQREMESDC